MIVEFIGQGLDFENDETCGNHICSAIQEKKFSNITIFAAFVRSTGLNLLKPFIKKAQEEKRKLTFYIGIDEKVTSKEALELLLELNIETYIYFSDSYIYHPKIYLFEGERNRVIVGSSNLTKSGLFFNVESSLLLDFTNNDNAGLKVLRQLKEFYSSLLDFSDPNIETLSKELINKLLEQDKISTEKFDYKTTSNFKSHDNSKKKRKNLKIGTLGSIEITETRNKPRYNRLLKITDDYLNKWDHMFDKMKIFYQENQHTIIPKDYEDRTLYGWYRKQKALYRENLIPQNHLKQLSEIEFNFGDGNLIRTQKTWMKRYNELLSIYKETGDANIKRYKDKNHPLSSISNWVAFERGKYRKGKLQQWQIEKLEEIGFKWEVTRAPSTAYILDDDWLDKLALLEEYKKEFGNCNVTQGIKSPKYKGLGIWLNIQRVSYKRKHSYLTKDRIQLLEDIGIIWDMDVYNFDLRIKDLVELKKEKGDFNIPSNYKPNPSLGHFVYRLKTKGVSDDWKIKKLHSIGFYEIGTKQKLKEFEGYITQNWLNNYNKLKKLTKTNLAKDDVNHPELAKWLNNQRRSYRYGKLKDKQISALQEIGIELKEKSNRKKTWDDYIELIELFKSEHGNVDITPEFDRELYKWIKLQKKNYSKNGLKQVKALKLVELGIVEA